jgi:hypothetical protein
VSLAEGVNIERTVNKLDVSFAASISAAAALRATAGDIARTSVTMGTYDEEDWSVVATQPAGRGGGAAPHRRRLAQRMGLESGRGERPGRHRRLAERLGLSACGRPQLLLLGAVVIVAALSALALLFSGSGGGGSHQRGAGGTGGGGQPVTVVVAPPPPSPVSGSTASAATRRAGTVSASLRLPIELGAIAPGTASRAAFERSFKQDVGVTLDVPSERVVRHTGAPPE